MRQSVGVEKLGLLPFFPISLEPKIIDLVTNKSYKDNAEKIGQQIQSENFRSVYFDASMTKWWFFSKIMKFLSDVSCKYVYNLITFIKKFA